ncbi:hypothetical protein EYF80_023866 [Liparis tanakae]|uniref:Uncharacterized protein n=1 Tax=Liparis tanakae TaxID=230148 RepID=A0A4Z2HJD1_9TELE|nr:hypothetical protein EYF80_023866 [Liparis tanakae]
MLERDYEIEEEMDESLNELMFGHCPWMPSTGLSTNFNINPPVVLVRPSESSAGVAVNYPKK